MSSFVGQGNGKQFFGKNQRKHQVFAIVSFFFLSSFFLGRSKERTKESQSQKPVMCATNIVWTRVQR